MSIRCEDVDCTQMFETLEDMLIHYTEPGSHQERIDTARVNGIKCPICGEEVSFDEIVSHSNTHIKNRDTSTVPPVSYKVSCLLDHLNTTQTLGTDVQHLYLSLIFDGCIFHRGAKRTTALSNSGLVSMRKSLSNRVPPTNLQILEHMQTSWSTDDVPSVDVLFPPRANATRVKRGQVNLLHLGLYVILTHVHRRYNQKTNLYRQPEEFPTTLPAGIREKLSCLSQYLEAAMQTMFSSVAMKSEMVDTQVLECNVCYNEDVPCVSLCSTGATHAICTDCTRTVVMEKLSDNTVTITTVYDVVCPFSLGDVPIHSIRPQVIKWAIGPFEYLERMQKAQETALALVVVIQCPNSQCTHTFTPEPGAATSTENRVCPACRVSICPYCNMLSHTVYSTPACAQSLEKEHEALFRNGGTLCPRCQTITSRDDDHMPSCIHMKCQCGHHYCWICLGDWSLHGGPNMFYSCRTAKDDGKYDYDDTVRRYYPRNPLTTFDTIDLSRLPRIYSKTIRKYMLDVGNALPKILIPDGRTLCPNCFHPASKLPDSPGGLHTRCTACRHVYCWHCLRPEIDHEPAFPRTNCLLERLPSYSAFYEDFKRWVYPGSSTIPFSRVVQSDWPYLTFKATVEPTNEEIESIAWLGRNR